MTKSMTVRKKVKGFLTKYALTTGIQEVEAELDSANEYDGKYVWYRMPGGYQNMVSIREFHENRADAEEAQKVMAKHAILRLKKQIDKLQQIIVKPKYAKGSE